LGLDPPCLQIEPRRLQPIFQIRNKIVHELDINFNAARRNRQTRRRDEMVTITNELLRIGEALCGAIAVKLAAAPAD
jgi:hypothetical protein